MLKRSIMVVPLVGLIAACTGSNSTSSTASTQRTVAIGSATGTAGGEVTVPIALTKVPPRVAVIAPLVFEFDPATLTFNNCTAKVAGKTVDALSPSPGRVSLALSGGMGVIPNGPIADCAFGINPGAAHGVSPLRFVRAGMADLELHDIAGTGADGSVTVK